MLTCLFQWELVVFFNANRFVCSNGTYLSFLMSLLFVFLNASGCFWKAILASPPPLRDGAGVVLGRLRVGLPLALRPCSCGARVRLTENLDAAACKFLRGLWGAVPSPHALWTSRSFPGWLAFSAGKSFLALGTFVQAVAAVFPDCETHWKLLIFPYTRANVPYHGS